MLSTMTEQPPDYETKDVYTTMADGEFETKDAGVPGYRPAAVPNADEVNLNPGKTEEAPAAAESGSDEGATVKKTTTRASAAKSS